MIGQLPGQCGQGDHPIKRIICMEMTEKCQDPITSFESLDIGGKIILTFNGWVAADGGCDGRAAKQTCAFPQFICRNFPVLNTFSITFKSFWRLKNCKTCRNLKLSRITNLNHHPQPPAPVSAFINNNVSTFFLWPKQSHILPTNACHPE